MCMLVRMYNVTRGQWAWALYGHYGGARVAGGLCGGGGAVGESIQSLRVGCGRKSVIHSRQAILTPGPARQLSLGS